MKITRYNAIEMIANHMVGTIVKQSEIGEFSTLKDLIIYGDGISNLDNKELSDKLFESTGIQYQVIDEKVEA